ncbi:hypothetical protein QNH98_09065 [Myroides sp. mNGS23_01]|nr:hypothetical protein [Myroides sp. mNGS23_01]WHT40665.1 hypothetical protein QNH98_09065 [Myroides sp. mNGS23_01]
MKFISTLFLLCFVSFLQAQVKAVKIPTDLDNITQAYHYNTKQKNFFFLKSYKQLQGILMTDSLTVKQSLLTIVRITLMIRLLPLLRQKRIKPRCIL